MIRCSSWCQFSAFCFQFSAFQPFSFLFVQPGLAFFSDEPLHLATEVALFGADVAAALERDDGVIEVSGWWHGPDVRFDMLFQHRLFQRVPITVGERVENFTTDLFVHEDGGLRVRLGLGFDAACHGVINAAVQSARVFALVLGHGRDVRHEAVPDR